MDSNPEFDWPDADAPDVAARGKGWWVARVDDLERQLVDTARALDLAGFGVNVNRRHADAVRQLACDRDKWRALAPDDGADGGGPDDVEQLVDRVAGRVLERLTLSGALERPAPLDTPDDRTDPDAVFAGATVISSRKFNPPDPDGPATSGSFTVRDVTPGPDADRLADYLDRAAAHVRDHPGHTAVTDPNHVPAPEPEALPVTATGGSGYVTRDAYAKDVNAYAGALRKARDDLDAERAAHDQTSVELTRALEQARAEIRWLREQAGQYAANIRLDVDEARGHT